MGREIKRVGPEVNEWELGKVWKGFLNPYKGRDCAHCRNGWDVQGAPCVICKGEGVHWQPGVKEKMENFYGDPPDPKVGVIPAPPPAGTWWQVWENVSEGSPVSPAFETDKELVEYLVENGDLWSQKRRKDAKRMGHPISQYDMPPSREQAEAFVKSGYAPSMMICSDGTQSQGLVTLQTNICIICNDVVEPAHRATLAKADTTIVCTDDCYREYLEQFYISRMGEA